MRWAVLTGDLVESSDMTSDEIDEIMRDIKAISGKVHSWNEDDDMTRAAFARRGGDSWQVAVNKTEFSLRLSLYIQSRIRAQNSSYATRIAIANGPGQLSDTPGADLNSAHGDAFTSSGQLLDTMSKYRHLAHADGGALDAVFRLADHISRGWTQAQARALCLMLPPASGPRRLAAEELGISRQAVDQALASAGYPALMDAINAVEAAS